MEAVSSFWFNTQFTLGRMPHVLRLKSIQHKIISPSIQIHFDNKYYEVKTANNAEELAQVLSLRFEVFFREFSTKKVSSSIFCYDVDMHDFICDHLIVKDKSTNQVVACYRLLSNNLGKRIKKFYSEGEFKLEEFLATEGNKLELGRACVHKDYRKGTVIALLWRGLLEYARRSNTRYMFGCSSINRKDFENIPKILVWLEENKAFIEDFNIGVHPRYRPGTSTLLGAAIVDPEERTEAKVLGSLMHMYVLAGAKLGRSLAYDAEMDCIDMFTLIDLKELPASFERRFSDAREKSDCY